MQSVEEKIELITRVFGKESVVMADVPFEVVDEVVITDLADVKESRPVLPVTPNVLFTINKVSLVEGTLIKGEKSASNPVITKSLNIELRLVEGILDAESGEMKYVNFPLFTRLFVWADLNVKTSNWWKAKQHLVGFKQLCMALGINLAEVRINDEWLSSLLGRQVRANILVKPEQIKSPETGEYVNVPDSFVNEVKFFKSV